MTITWLLLIPFLGGLVSGVTTRPADGTIEIKGAVGTVTARPQVADGGLTLQVVELTGLGFTLPRETVQPALPALVTDALRDPSEAVRLRADEDAGAGIAADELGEGEGRALHPDARLRGGSTRAAFRG